MSCDDEYATAESAERLATFKDDEWDARVESVFGGVGPFSGAALGLQLQNRDFSALGEGADYLQPTSTRTDAFFVFAEAPLADRVRLQTGSPDGLAMKRETVS